MAKRGLFVFVVELAHRRTAECPFGERRLWPTLEDPILPHRGRVP
jgi:hypothetical protein